MEEDTQLNLGNSTFRGVVIFSNVSGGYFNFFCLYCLQETDPALHIHLSQSHT